MTDDFFPALQHLSQWPKCVSHHICSEFNWRKHPAQGGSGRCGATTLWWWRSYRHNMLWSLWLATWRGNATPMWRLWQGVS